MKDILSPAILVHVESIDQTLKLIFVLLVFFVAQTTIYRLLRGMK